MIPTVLKPPASAFFLDGENGRRFCLFHAPAPGVEVRGAFVYVHPFGEEMNCARRIAAKQARLLADRGYGVLQIDLSGCGDSSGDFGDASWGAWLQDIADAVEWVREHCSPRISLWGLRLGALLALDASFRLPLVPEHLLLWQPVVNGRQYLTQFLRLALATQMISTRAPLYRDTRAMREALSTGATLEIGGYDLSGALTSVVDSVDATQLALPRGRVHWVEFAPEEGVIPLSSHRLINAWRAGGVKLDVELIEGVPFWTSPGHLAAPALFQATERMLPGE